MIPERIRRGVAAVLGFVFFALPAPAAAQHALVSPAGDSLRFELPQLRTMLDTARALYADLQEDPRVLYSLGFGPRIEPSAPRRAYPWNAVIPQSDSVVTVVTPGNLREADRAYHNYAVMRMRVIRGTDPDDPCDELVARERTVLSSFVDGWILARTLFGGPPFAPLDELAFARDAGHLPALLAAYRDASVGACAATWAEDHPDAIAAYRQWRDEAFPDLAPVAADSGFAAPPDEPARPLGPPVEERLPDEDRPPAPPRGS